VALLGRFRYRNVVSGTDAGGKPETWHMSWVDVFVREDGRWKIGASHLVSERVEKAVERDARSHHRAIRRPAIQTD
jgi:hypothetical protein